MGIEWLELVVELLETAGIRAGEEYAVGTAPEITEPVAAVGLSALECSQGQAAITVSVVSPRTLGGWECQTAAAKAVAALEAAQIHCQMGSMGYLSDCDCYNIAVTARIDICLVDGAWVKGTDWTVTLDDTAVEWVSGFTAEQDQGRRLITATCQTDPIGVTPGTGGWVIKLEQQIPQGGVESQMPEEPFVLEVSDGLTVQVYTDCYWNEVQRSCSQGGMTIQRQGFALTREVQSNG